MLPIVWLIPTRDEESAIGETLSRIPPEHSVFVMDSSIDRTAQVSAEYGAKVVRVEEVGKGIAVKRGLEVIREAVEGDAIVVMVDGDGTYDPRDHVEMIRQLDAHIGMVIGNRFHNPQNGSFSWSHLIANRVLTRLANTRFGVRLMDVLSGFKVFRLKSINPTMLRSDGFDTEIDFLHCILKHGLEVLNAPINYRSRDGSRSKIRVRDGLDILHRILF